MASPIHPFEWRVLKASVQDKCVKIRGQLAQSGCLVLPCRLQVLNAIIRLGNKYLKYFLGLSHLSSPKTDCLKQKLMALVREEEE